MNRRGLTLLELLVAMAVGMLVLTVSAQAVRQSWQTREHVRAESDHLAAARAAFQLLTRDLEQARPGDLRIERRAGTAAPRLTTGADVPAPVLASYRVYDRTLWRRERLRLAVRADAPEIPLLTGVVDLDVRCLADGEWQATWDRPTLPEAFHVTLQTDDDVRLETIVVPATRGNG
jgi:prepilin-type N-terminal cleavage/methylation domain-containing protein